MDRNNFTNDYFELITGISNKAHPVYLEATKDAEKSTVKGLNNLRKFITSMEQIVSSKKVVDPRISKSKGNIKNFEGYENISFAIEFTSKNLASLGAVKECKTILDALEKNQPLYTEGYEKKIPLVTLEYENSVYLLITALSMLLANNVDITTNGSDIKISKREGEKFNVINKTLSDLSKVLSDSSHIEYLKQIIDVSNTEEYQEAAMLRNFNENGSIWDTYKILSDVVGKSFNILKSGVKLKDRVIRTIFGIVPLMRSIVYLRYNKKADTINKLNDQIASLQNNIEILKNKKNVSEVQKASIIRKQEAYINSYRKKAAKIRAELTENEKDTVADISKVDNDNRNNPLPRPSMPQPAPQRKDPTPAPRPEQPRPSAPAPSNNKSKDDDDFVLEATGHKVVIKPSKNVKIKKNKKITKSNSDILRIRKNSLSFSDIFKTKMPSNPDDIDKSTDEIDFLLENAYKAFYKDTDRKCINLDPGKQFMRDDDETKRTATKIGGIPYWPNNKEFPKYKNEDMIMLAQLNFSTLPKLDGFPNSGIMQFFVYDTEYETIGSNDRVKVVYHDKVLPKRDWSTINENHTTINKKLEDGYAPIYGVYFPKATLTTSSMNEYVDGYENLLCKYINKEFNTNWKSYSAIPIRIKKRMIVVSENLKNDDTYAGCKIGGYPYFTQYDPREKDPRYDILMLQLDSGDGMMWGDCGVANFFTSNEAMKSKNFDKKVLFTWDCC